MFLEWILNVDFFYQFSLLSSFFYDIFTKKSKKVAYFADLFSGLCKSVRHPKNILCKCGSKIFKYRTFNLQSEKTVFTPRNSVLQNDAAYIEALNAGDHFSWNLRECFRLVDFAAWGSDCCAMAEESPALVRKGTTIVITGCRCAELLLLKI